MKHDIKQVRSFGRYAAGTSDIYRPTDVDEVKQVFEIARNSKGKQRVTVRGGGHSFNGQALHNQDTGSQLILSGESFDPERIVFNRDANTVTLGSGVTWGRFVDETISQARKDGAPILLPGSMQTGGKATVGGTLSADCLSRFSGTVGKESRWIDSFRILTPTSANRLEASPECNPDLFNAVIGGHGYIGFVTDVTYKLMPIHNTSCARTEITTHKSFGDLIQKQMQLIKGAESPRGVSSAWFSGKIFPNLLHPPNPGTIKGAVFNSSYAKPSHPKLLGFPLYHGLHSKVRYLTEVAARTPWIDSLVDLVLYALVHIVHKFEDPLKEFLFFMDGDAAAREKFEKKHYPQLFPIVQQTYVVPAERTEKFAETCMRKIRERKLHATECDMLFVSQDECLLSANYHLDGFAVSFAFEPAESNGGPPNDIIALLRELSVDCLNAGGRIHLPKNSHVDNDTFRSMFQGQIERFEKIKRQYDPELLLQNTFSDQFFEF